MDKINYGEGLLEEIRINLLNDPSSSIQILSVAIEESLEKAEPQENTLIYLVIHFLRSSIVTQSFAFQVPTSRVDHADNNHHPTTYSQQLKYKPKEAGEKELEYKSFFNKNWTKEDISEAMNYGYNEASNMNITDSDYTFNFNGESVTIALKNGEIKTAYGDYKHTYEELLRRVE